MNLVQVYNEIDDGVKDKFNNNLSSDLKVNKKSHTTSYDDTWLVKMEETIKYLDNILRSPNRFIVNEEEIVKIELARRITVDSIKHLSRNTNFIQSFDPKTGEVRPSKILNINKEESFNTYENRFIYTLINNMKMYIERKKNENISFNSSENNFDMNYHGTSKVGSSNVEISVSLIEKSKSESKENDLLDRISKVEQQVKDLCSSDVYKTIAKLHVAPVVSPIKKTNLILKNVNFQYALDLWNYLQTHMEESTKIVNDNKKYDDNLELKNLMNESFILNYQIVQTLKDNNSEDVKDTSNKIINSALSQLMQLKNELSLDDIIKIVGDEFVKVKYKKVVDTSEIVRVYKEAINEYIGANHELKVVKNESAR